MRVKSDSLTLKLLSGVVVATGAAALVSSCGGGGGDSTDAAPTVSATTIDTAGVNKAIADFGGTIAVCKSGTSGALQTGRGTGLAASILGGSKLLAGMPQGGPSKHALALGSTAPVDQLGNCGGRYGYRNYNHSNGVTNATLAFENYCQRDSDTGETQVTNGGITFVNTATPTASGPITTQITASSSGALTTVKRTSAGATVSSETINFSGFKMDIGVPGGTPTAAKPNVLALGDITVKNDVTGKTYRQTNYAMSEYQTPAGNTEFVMTGRGFRSDGSYYDISTPVPVAQGKDGNVVGGQMKFSGADNSNAVATLVPGATMQVTLTVNGTPVTSVPTCKD
jgi:hypothetical protein